MKKIINGKVYDTCTARLVAEHDSGHAANDFHWFREELYVKKTGEFFLFGKGHAASPYAHSCPSGGYDPGEKIVPLTFEEAQSWAEKHLDAEEYCKIFGEPDEDAEDVALNLIISAAASAKLKKAAAQNGISLRAQLERWILEAK